MSSYLLPIGFAIFAWWFGTGLAFLLERGTRGWPRLPARGAIVGVAAASLYGLRAASFDATPAGSYLGFTCGVAFWGAQEIAFLSGWMTGPRSSRLPPALSPALSPAKHFLRAVQALLYHELALVAGAALVFLLTRGHANATGAWTFVLLWAMRESAKLNLHLGVRNPGVELLPAQLAHLREYFGQRAFNALFPLSLAVSLGADIWLARDAIDVATPAFARAGELMLATLLALGIIEHLVLVLPVRADLLWRWATRRRPTRTGPGARRQAAYWARSAGSTSGPA